MKTKEEVLHHHLHKVPSLDYGKTEHEFKITMAAIFDAMEEYAKEYYNEHRIKLKDSDCTCYGDHYGMATNTDCILHGNKR